MPSKSIYTKKELIVRNEFQGDPEWGIPLLEKANVDVEQILRNGLIGFDQIKNHDYKNVHKTVHFFKYDEKFAQVYNSPDAHLEKLVQYKCVLTPDFSLYRDMPRAEQIHSVFQNRWCGAKWQEFGMNVIPTVSWSDEKSFEYCFIGIPMGSVVAVSTLGVHKNKERFMKGYAEMIKRIRPECILCFDIPFPEMEGNVLFIDYQNIWRKK